MFMVACTTPVQEGTVSTEVSGVAGREARQRYSSAEVGLGQVGRQSRLGALAAGITQAVQSSVSEKGRFDVEVIALMTGP